MDDLGIDATIAELTAVPEDWTDERVRRFAEWFGYQINEKPDSASGYSVVSPSGAHLGGFAASSVIAAWQKNPTAGGPGAKGKGGKAAGPSATEKKAAADAKKAQTDAAKLESAKANAVYVSAAVNPEAMAKASKGKLDAGDIGDMVSEFNASVKLAKTPEDVARATKDFRLAMTQYKTQSTMKPPSDTIVKDTVTKLKSSLPSATVLAGTSFDESRIQQVIDKHTKLLDGAQSPEEAQQVIKDMRTAIAEDKVAQAKEKAEKLKEQKDAAAAAKQNATAAKATHATIRKTPTAAYLTQGATSSGAGAAKPAAGAQLPKTASEWADHYLREWYGFDTSDA